MQDLKYFASFIFPYTTMLALASKGVYSYLTILLFFLIVPLTEPLNGFNVYNYDTVTCYPIIPIAFGIIAFIINTWKDRGKPSHSWNSSHDLGTILPNELTRQAGNHSLVHKQFQNFDRQEDVKHLRFGWSSSKLFSLCSSLWFKKMNPILS